MSEKKYWEESSDFRDFWLDSGIQRKNSIFFTTKIQTLKWLGHIEKMADGRFVNRIYTGGDRDNCFPDGFFLNLLGIRGKLAV